MDQGLQLLIVGASTRAAAFSAMRAGFRPICWDLFADVDLARHCRVTLIPRTKYPHGIAQLWDECQSPAPWMYTGGIENYPDLVRRLQCSRELWGNGPEVLAAVRSPLRLLELGFPVPPTTDFDRDVPRDGSWLQKPAAGSGGTGIHAWHGPGTNTPSPRRRHYQRRVAGTPLSALFAGDGRAGCRLLGVTKQLVGESWLHPQPFAYCGSIGPVQLQSDADAQLRALGAALVQATGLCGLFGADLVQDGERLWLIEVNPRYTASAEIVEAILQEPLMALHRAGSLGNLNASSLPTDREASSGRFVGKAILFARSALRFPADGPWLDALSHDPREFAPPPFADVPQAGSLIEAGHPVLTIFASGDTPADCEERLRCIAANLDQLFHLP